MCLATRTGRKYRVGREQNKKRKMERDAILANAKAKRDLADRHNKFWIYGTGIVLILVLIVSVVSANIINQRHRTQLAIAASKPIPGVKSFPGLTRKHTSAQVNYPQNPPVGGDHSPEFINCGIYTHPINKWEAVHSLEHGAVWVTYKPDLPGKEITALAKEASSRSYELLSPYPGLPSPIVASAWGLQLELQSAADPRLPIFLQKYLQGPQTPEPGAACSGGIPG
jgi:hypothetical protein